MLEGTLFLLKESLDRSVVFTVLGLASLSTVLAGYFGVGPAALFLESDEYVIMPSPVRPYQVFLAKYVHRIIRKVFIIALIILALYPLLGTVNFLAASLVILFAAWITFSEINFFLGGISSYIRIKIEQKTEHWLRHIILIVIAFLVYFPTTAGYSQHAISHLFIPSNAVSMIIIETTGILSIGYLVYVGVICLSFSFVICLLVLANLTNYDCYDEFSKIAGKEEAEGKYSKMIRGEVEFSETRFKDPIAWVMLKDFWSKMRTPLQFWKYVYIIIGTVFAVYLNIARPPWLRPMIIPPELSSAAIPAFLLMLILLTQMVSITSLLAFVEEKENVYLLKVSPFRDRDIILGKYLLSIIEICLAALPVYSIIMYFFSIRGAGFLISVVAPFVLIFSASGIMVGAYIPVFTNDPRTPPVPLAFAFPAINLAIGGLLVGILGGFAQDPYLLIILPSVTVGFVTLFLGLAVLALGHYR
jgi:hypothetical protein